MTTEVDKITNAPTQNELIDKVNEVIDNLGGGGGSTDVFWCTYGTTQFDEMRTAQNEGKILLCNFSGYTLRATTYSSNLIRFYTFSSSNIYYTISATKTGSGTTNWNESTTTLQAYKLSSTLNSLSTTDTYPNSKIVYDRFQEKQDIISAGPNIQITQDINNNVLLTYYNDCANIGSQTWYCITYVKDSYIALGYYGWIGQSIDGETWSTNRISELDSHSWRFLFYNETSNKYVAIGQRGYISTATALDAWDTPTQNSELSTRSWYGGIYDGSKYILISDAGYISTSVDCEIWTTPTRVILGRTDWYGIAYGNGKYVALSSSGYVSTSDDFITWTTPVQYSNLGSYLWYGLNFDGEKFIALSYYGYISTSTNGTDWLSRFGQENLNRNGWYGITSRPSDKKIVVLDNNGYTSHSRTTPTISADVPTESTVSGWGFTKNTGTVTSVNNVQPDSSGNVTISVSGGANTDLSNLTSTGNNLVNTALNTRDNSTRLKFWTGTKAQYDAISTKDSNTLYNITDDQDVTLTLLQTIYPVGSVYLSTNSTCPLASLFGTWTLVSSGKALWTGTGSNGGSTINAGLPNITANWSRASERNVISSTDTLSGAFTKTKKGTYKTFGDSSSSYSGGNLSFDASRSSSIYGNSTTVQPPAYVVNVWRRTA